MRSLEGHTLPRQLDIHLQLRMEGEGAEFNNSLVQLCFMHCYNAGRTENSLFWHMLSKTTGSTAWPNGGGKNHLKMQ